MEHHVDIHKSRAGGRVPKKFLVTYQNLVQRWHDKGDYTCDILWFRPTKTSPEYMAWYMPRTLVFLQHPERRATSGFIGSSEFARSQVIFYSTTTIPLF